MLGDELILLTVRDITWMNVQSVHLAKWMIALEQVYQISDSQERHLP